MSSELAQGVSPAPAVAALRSAATALAAFLLALTLLGCGFRPLHQPQPDSLSEGLSGSPAPAVDRLAGVRVDPLPDRQGQQFHNLLIDRLNPLGQPSAPAYRLQVDLNQFIEKLALRRDETATRANLILRSSFTLRAAGDDSVLYSGRAVSINSYNILDQQYPTDVARADALERGLRELSDDITLRLSIYFRTVEESAL